MQVSMAKRRSVLPPIALVRALQSASASAKGCVSGPVQPPWAAQPARSASAAADSAAWRSIGPLLRGAWLEGQGALRNNGAVIARLRAGRREIGRAHV